MHDGRIERLTNPRSPVVICLHPHLEATGHTMMCSDCHATLVEWNRGKFFTFVVELEDGLLTQTLQTSVSHGREFASVAA